jgi:prepilin-type N-terminal cleavage/methylation domain-containing protein
VTFNFQQKARKGKNAGFTLIETIIVLGLVAVLSVALGEIFIGQYKIYKIEFSELIVQFEARQALDEVTNQVRSAHYVLDEHEEYATGSQTLILQVQSINAANQLIPGVFDIVLINLDGKSLTREIIPDEQSVRPAQSKQLSGNVTSLNFSYNSEVLEQVTEVETGLSVTDENVYQNRTFSASSKARLRNR